MLDDLKHYVACGLMLLTMSSCDKKQATIDDLEDFAMSLKEESRYYTTEEWDEAATAYESIVEELSHYEYTDGELRKIGRLEGQCIGYFTKGGLRSIKEAAEDFSKQLEGMSVGFMDAINEDENVDSQ